MGLEWTKWLTPSESKWGAESPYVNWFAAAPPEEAVDPNSERTTEKLSLTAPLDFNAFSVVFGRNQTQAMKSVSDGDGSTKPKKPIQAGPDFGSVESPQVPVPGFARNSGFNDYLIKSANGWEPNRSDLEAIPANSVIVGVIDSGISLGNERFRFADGKTRILASWQQNGNWEDKKQGYLPFGREVYKHEIDSMLAKHSVGGIKCFLVEDDFNRDTGTVNMLNFLGHRELAGRTSHGNHVLDIAAGYNPGEEQHVHIISVNLPHRATINNSGIFLDYFTVYGIKRIADLADLIWEKSGSKNNKFGSKGFPIVINMSFGKNAGPKDGGDDFQTKVNLINDARVADGYAPITLIIPVGNHNLEQGNAHLRLPAGGQDQITFHTSPEDHSGNYLEVWCEPTPYEGDLVNTEMPNPLEIAVGVPGQSDVLVLSSGFPRSQKQIGLDGKAARLYCLARRCDLNGSKAVRVGYLLCTAPTVSNSQSVIAAPSGDWTVVLRNNSSKPMVVQVSAQTDQSIRPRSATGLRPRLQYPDYERYEPNGRVRDTFSFPYKVGMSDLDNSKVLRRHGSINNTGISKRIVSVAGFRRTDGKPADYSATGFGFNVTKDPHYGDSRSAPTISLVTDDGAAHFGTLAAGASNGSIAAMRGTSFAAAGVTRMISQEFKKEQLSDFDVEKWLFDLGAKAELRSRSQSPPAEKIGAGRVETPEMIRVARLGPSLL
jgi:Subtilase family